MGRRVLAITVVAASLAVLVGCATPVQPDGLSRDQVAAYAASMQDVFWGQSGLDESLRPDVAPLEFVRFGDVATYYAECMNERDPTGTTYTPADLSGPGSQTTRFSRAQLIAYYECQSLYQARPKDVGYFSSAQLNATYDYYRDWLIPCLAVRGFDVQYVPERSVLALGPGQLTWNPYEDIHIDDPALTRLTSQCPPYPSFLHD